MVLEAEEPFGPVAALEVRPSLRKDVGVEIDLQGVVLP